MRLMSAYLRNHAKEWIRFYLPSPRLGSLGENKGLRLLNPRINDIQVFLNKRQAGNYNKPLHCPRMMGFVVK